MQQPLARRAAKDASPLFPSTSGSSSESDEAFRVAGPPLRPFVSTRGQPAVRLIPRCLERYVTQPRRVVPPTPPSPSLCAWIAPGS